MKKIAIYISISSLHLANQEFLIQQRQILVNYAATILNSDDIHIFQDIGFSSPDLSSKPMLQQLIKSIHANEFSHVLVYRYDRISKNLKVNLEFQHELRNNYVTLISLRERFGFYG